MKIRHLIAAAAVATAASAAMADTIDVRFTGTARGQNVHVASALFNGNVFAGQLMHELTNGTGAAADFNGTYPTFCTDLTQHVTSTTRTYDVVPVDVMPNNTPMGIQKAEAIRRMYAFEGGNQLLGTTSNDLAAAFQLAVWEIISDYNPAVIGYNLSMTGGSFQATKTDGSALASGVQTQLTALFSAVGIETGLPATAVIGIRSSTCQDQLVPIPTPGALALSGLGGLCLVRRNRK